MFRQPKLYRRAFEILGDFTPLKLDCGTLCQRRCCDGDAKTGMLLFPGEQTMLPVREENNRRIAVCGGSCRRAERPLACRLFPLFPVPDARGVCKAVVDPRGGICPLVRHAQDVRFSARFQMRVAHVGTLLMRSKECRVFLEQIWSEMDEAQAVRDTFFTSET